MGDPVDKQWLVDYRYRGQMHSITVYAPTPHEAKNKLTLAATYGVVVGEVQMVIPASAGSWLARAICAWKNFWGHK